jgi:hypothetical protein
MARFYFHFVSNRRYVYDGRGEELHSLVVAHLHSLKLIFGTLRFMEPSSTERWTVQVANAAGKVLLTVLFPSASGQPVSFGRRDRRLNRSHSGRRRYSCRPASLRAQLREESR